MTDKEAKELLEELALRPENLPKILESDPQVKILNGKVGQIIKIDRTENGIKVPYYRIIVEG